MLPAVHFPCLPPRSLPKNFEVILSTSFLSFPTTRLITDTTQHPHRHPPLPTRTMSSAAPQIPANEVAAVAELDGIIDSGKHVLKCPGCDSVDGFKKNTDKSRRRRYQCRHCLKSFTWRVAEDIPFLEHQVPRVSEIHQVEPPRASYAPR
jgi:hypothetical protein